MIRTKSGAAGLSIASNSVLIALKLAAGAITGSIAIITEAIHSLIDLVASVIAFISVRKADEPADADHPYGHEKSENLAAAVEGVLVLAAGVAVAVEAIRRLASGAPAIDHIGLAVGVMAASAVVNLLVSLRLRRVARRTGSPAIEGDAAHLAADVWTSAGAAVGLALVAVTGWEPLDAIVALAVAGYVAAVGARLVWRAAHVLLDGSLPEGDMRVIEQVLAGFRDEGVSFHAVRGRRAGSKRLIDFHMVVPPETTVRRGHAMTGRVKRDLVAALPGTEVLIHLEDHEPGTRGGRVLDRRGETIAP
jgi:cation diffusion facilitator family transporter